jgi:PKD repeat protein
MKTIKLSLLLFTAGLFSVNTNAQSLQGQDWCKTDQNAEELKTKNPALIQEEINFRQQLRDYIDNNPSSSNEKTSPYIIPVVVHNITNNGAGYVSKATIEAQLVTLNEDYQRNNVDAANTRALFLPYAMSMNIEFRLAHLDPNGNCTEGIVRVESPLSTNATDAVKAVSYWDSKKYFNIWVVDIIDGSNPPSYIAGYAQFPWSGINSTYGIIVDNTFFGGGQRTLTHEVGHCFGLLHTFQSGCGSNCSSSGDFICDTPPVANSTGGCNTSQNSCSNDSNGPDPYNTDVVDQIENYMSYDACQNMFTLEQQAAMESTLNSTSTSQGLNQLNTTANRAATGVADPYGPVICKPIAEFSYDKEYICEGASVTFTDDSWGSDATVWNWTFTGGSPTTSSSQNPTITYSSAGVYGVTLVASNTAPGSDTETKNNIITVSSLTADYIGPVIDGFENTTTFSNDWRIESNEGQVWQNNTTAAATGSRSVRILNYFTGSTGEVDQLISPSYDISALSSPGLKFKVAYAQTTSTDADKLMVYYSTNCGASWVLKVPMVGAGLATVPIQTNMFTPSSAGDWEEKTVNLTSSSNIRFKFEFVSGGGNNIYLDDINITGAVGVDEFSNIGSFNVFPNPTNSSAQISFNLIKDVKNLNITVRNAVGQEVTNVIKGQSFSSGKYTLNIDEQRKLSSGIYFVEFNADNVIKVQKLIVQ